MTKNKITYDDGIDRALMFIEVFRPHTREEGHSDEFIQRVFKGLVEVLKAEKSDAIV